ncbi:MAG TPA: glycoside hydrolase family 9 protein [Planctomycetota bacterium]|jgi:endoglucanase|nr:glycoside hydrolase family 9 protein [Planctomycetota bacterium]
MGSTALSATVTVAVVAAGLAPIWLQESIETSSRPWQKVTAEVILGASSLDSNDAALSAPWIFSLAPRAEARTEQLGDTLCVDVQSPGKQPLDVRVRKRYVRLVRDCWYEIAFNAHASSPVTIRPGLRMTGPPYRTYWEEEAELTLTPKRHAWRFRMRSKDDPEAELVLDLGGGEHSPFKVFIGSVSLAGPDAQASPTGEPTPMIGVNQIGYFADGTKHAVLAHSSRSPLAWTVHDATGRQLLQGLTSVHGHDRAAGEHLHQIDFSALTQPGAGYSIQVDEMKSPRFRVGVGLYAQLKVDALAFFYHSRSGTPIEMPFAGSEEYTRPAGHLNDARARYVDSTGTAYTLDLTGGWYDAGDHGKYVVSGAIAVWTLFNLHERTRLVGTSSGDFADGALAIPERYNRVPDLLDETRWELEWMLRMQVPPHAEHAGMVHHKIHGKDWTPIPQLPHEDGQGRVLHPPTTAATLGMAACAAQGARIFRSYDSAFARRCLEAAETAWLAALEEPRLFNPPGRFQRSGGGDYGDADVSDEFYWAAAELFITTGEETYLDHARASRHFLSLPSPRTGKQSSISWQEVAGLGTVSLALVPSELDSKEREIAREEIVAVAREYAARCEAEGYRLPLTPTVAGRYPWGSNAYILNNMILLGLAHDFSGEDELLAAMIDGMDYLLGRNPLAQCYVTGYGDMPLRNPHHRFWANQKDASFPKAPPGVMVGGPNSSARDPIAREASLRGRPAQRCFVDHIDSWATNEVAINWNAPLAWVAAFLDE